MAHEVSGLRDLIINPVLKSSTPLAGVATALYVVPGAPVDCQVSALRISNPSGDTDYSIGFSTQANSTVVYFENGTVICENDSQDAFMVPIWLPPTTTIWVKSTSGGVVFAMFGAEYGSPAGSFTGS